MLNRTSRSTRPSKRSERSCATTPPRSPAQTTQRVVAEHLAHQRLHVARVGGGVVAVVGRQARSRRSRAGRGRSPRSRHRRARPTLRHQIRRVSGQPWISSSGKPPRALARVGELHPVRPRRGGARTCPGRATPSAEGNLLGRWTATTPARSSPGGSACGPTSAPGRCRNEDDGAPKALRAGDAALPVGRAAHRPPEDLLGGRRGGALPAPQRPPRAAPDGLRRLRPAGREPRHQDRPAPARVHRGLDRRVPAPVPQLGHLDRLVARVRPPTSPATTAGPSGCSCACSSTAWPTATRRR